MLRRLLIISALFVLVGGLGAQWIDPVPFGLSAARGTNGSGVVNKFGFNTDVDNAELTVYEGLAAGGAARVFTNQSGAYTLYISSDNGADADTTMTVQGLDASWAYQSVDVILGPAGIDTVQVGSASGWRRVFRSLNTSTTALTGTVYLHLDSNAGADGIPDNPTTDIITVVNAGEDQTLMATYTIPDGKAGYMGQWCISNLGGGGSDPTTFRLRTVSPQGTASRVQQMLILGAGDSLCVGINPPLRFAEQSDIEVTAISTGAGSSQNVSANFDMVLFDE